MSLSNHQCKNDEKATITCLSRYVEVNEEIAKYELSDQPLTSEAVCSIIRSELKLDGNPALNLASFVTTEIEEGCQKLVWENLNKNLVDTSQYPHSNELQDRCINILANLFHAPSNDQDGAIGTATIGSSEAIMLAGLALKWRWRSKQAEKQGKKIEEVLDRCNLIFSAAVHVSVLKLCRYFDIEPRIIPLEENSFILNIDKVISQCDENTCGVLAVLGTTLTGEFEDIEQLNRSLLKLKKDRNIDIPIHVDGASGAMIAPFIYPDLLWDFRLEQVRSINTSAHKYGLVYPGLGWVIWREKQDLPEDLIFHVNYLGIDEATFNLNFSRSAANVIGQYYQFLRLGFQGYQKIVQSCKDNANYISQSLISMVDGLFLIRSEHSQPSLPMIAFSFNPLRNLPFNEKILIERLKERGWIIPVYTLAANANHITVCRIVVRETLTRNIASILLEDIRLVILHLAQQYHDEQLILALKQTQPNHYQHRRTKQHQQYIQSNTENHPQTNHIQNNPKKNKHSTVHIIC